jgi:acid phosphatase type 7
MINAGDSGYTHASHNLSKLVVKYKPDIFFMGGDVAYDNNIPACAYTWDFFLNMIEGISNEVGYIIPLVLTVGNHDVGLNELSGINITLDKTPFFIYFPQHFHRDASGNITNKVPPINNRSSFNRYIFGNVIYITLDSGYLHGFDGLQKIFIKESFEINKKKVKFVNYHVPIYSICENFDKDPRRYLYALFHWVPLFDEYKVMTAFENHIHSFKRTKPLKSNQPA